MDLTIYIRNERAFIKANGKKPRGNTFHIHAQAPEEINAICLKDVGNPG